MAINVIPLKNNWQNVMMPADNGFFFKYAPIASIIVFINENTGEVISENNHPCNPNSPIFE